MSIDMKAAYKNHEIVWNDRGREFLVKFEGVELRVGFHSIADCEKYIDGRTKQVFKRVPVICRFYWSGTLQKAEATSLVGEEEVWVTDGKNRGKEPIARVYLDNEKNTKILAEVEAIKQEIEKAEKRIDELMGSLDRLTPAHMIEENM